MGEFSIREGQLSDCKVIARLINESSEGAADYLFGSSNGKRSGNTAEEIVSEMLAREVHYSYANTLVVQIDGKVIGMALSFPASGLFLSEQIQQFYNAQQFQYIQYFAEHKLKDSWHLDAICIDSEFRRNGVGQQLLDLVKQQAKYYKFPVLEVFVFGRNEGAIQFYRRNGFVVCKQISVSKHEFLQNKSPLMLMRCDLMSNA